MNNGEIILYQPDKYISIEVRMEAETVWLNLNQMAMLFDRDKSVISRHIRNIYSEGELNKEATVAKNATVQMESGRQVMRQIEYYNLDVIISVGYRVKSLRGTQFRQWATGVLKEYLLYEVRGLRVMLDRDLAELYNVETRALNQAVKRNIDRFPEDFMFVMTDDEMNAWKSQIVMSNSIRMGMRRPPVVFTELGIAMLSSVLRSETAIQVNINIMRAFVAIRHAIGAWQGVNLKVEQLSHKVDNLNARVDENNLGAEHIAELLGQPIEQVFKTLVLRGDKTGLFVCVIPGAEEVDLKKAAKVTGNKKVEMIHVKELLPLTGYIRGGCSPIGMKKPLPTWFHQTLTDYDTVYCSAGQRGLQFRLAPQELVRAAKGTLADLIV